MKYYTMESKLTGRGDFMARVVTSKTYTEDDLVDKILEKRNIISRPDLRGVISALKEAVSEIVREGNCLNLPWLKLGYSMKGSFKDRDAARNPEKHRLEISMKAGAMLTGFLSEVKLERVSHPNFNPRIVHFIDSLSSTKDSQLTPGGVFKITGEYLRIGGPRPDQVGLYLRAQDGTETKVEILICNEPRTIVGQLPAELAVGSYTFVVRTQLGTNGNPVNEVRTGFSKFSLTVA